MSQHAHIQFNVEASVFTAILHKKVPVAYGQNPEFEVLHNTTLHKAGLAASCLLQPQKEDIVLVALLEDGQYMILSVLFTQAAKPAMLQLPQNSTMECAGNFTLRSKTNLHLESGQSMHMKAENMQATAQEATMHAVKAHTVCETLEICTQNLLSLSKRAVSMFTSFTQCLGQSRRIIEGHDETQCATSTLVAEENVTVMSNNTTHMAKQTARTDAKLIQLG